MTRAPLAATDTLLTRINGRRGQGTVESGKDAVSAYQMPLEMQTLIELRGQPGECARSLRARYASTAVCEGASRQRAATKDTGTRRARMLKSWHLEDVAGRQRSPPAAGGMDDDESTTGSYRYIADQDKRVRRGQGHGIVRPGCRAGVPDASRNAGADRARQPARRMR